VRILLSFLVLILVAGCEPKGFLIEIPFKVKFEGMDLACSDTDSTVALSDLRFFVHDVRLVGQEDQEIPVRLVRDGVWQSRNVALLDFEDGEGACMNGSARTHTMISGITSDIDAKGLIFEIGVPESLNHADPLLAEPPLNYTDMHWHWASGYKFFRGGVVTDGDGFWMHLGSSRCQGTIGDIRGCLSANRPTIRLDGFEPGKHAVVLDLATLFAAVALDDGQPTDCSSGPAETDCEAPFAVLGIDFASGDSKITATPFELGPAE